MINLQQTEQTDTQTDTRQVTPRWPWNETARNTCNTNIPYNNNTFFLSTNHFMVISTILALTTHSIKIYCTQCTLPSAITLDLEMKTIVQTLGKVIDGWVIKPIKSASFNGVNIGVGWGGNFRWIIGTFLERNFSWTSGCRWCGNVAHLGNCM